MDKRKLNGFGSDIVSKKYKFDPNIPDFSYGDLYCKLCDSHMNCRGMWDAHIIGKRHQKNIEKGETDTKYEILNVETDLTLALKKVQEPVIGLSYIHEIRKQVNVPPLYTCFLCSATLATIDIVIEHITSFKHKKLYMKEINCAEYKLIEATNIGVNHMESLVNELAFKLEEQNGRGEVLVKQEKSKYPPIAGPRFYGYGFESDRYKWQSNESFNTRLKSDTENGWKKTVTLEIVPPISSASTTTLLRSGIASKNKKSAASSISNHEHPGPKTKSSEDRINSDNISKKEYLYPKVNEFSSLLILHNILMKIMSFDFEVKKTELPLLLKVLCKTENKLSQNLPYDSETLCQKYSIPMVNLIKSQSSILSNEANPEKIPKSVASSFIAFRDQAYKMPTEIFLHWVLHVLENIEVKEIKELSMLSKVLVRLHFHIYNNLSSEDKARIEQL